VREARFTDHGDNPFRSVARIVYDDERGMVYIEVESKHDGQIIVNACGMPRVVFSERVRNIPGLLP
jgi:hypothetical protein